MSLRDDPLLAAYTFSEKAFDMAAFETRLPHTRASRIVLFGAGGWGEALLEELEQREVPLPIVFTDNDRTKHDQVLSGKAVLSPESLSPENDLVIITTVSAGDQVSEQLEDMGFQRNRSYFEVMHKFDCNYTFKVMDLYQEYVPDVSGQNILHVGPGGNLGVELLLAALGARSVYSVERHSFRLRYPNVTRHKQFYSNLAHLAKERWHHDLLGLGLLTEKDEKLLINRNRIRLLFPCSVTDLPFKGESFDLVLHYGVFEHVRNPEQGYREIFRVLRKGGITVGNVGPLDHRSMSTSHNYHPLKFLEHSRDEWYGIAEDINFHNQVTTPEHKEMILKKGFSLNRWDDGRTIDISEEMWNSFHPMFKGYERNEIGILDFCFSAQKPPI